jgi:hypothetical protein
MKLLAIFPLKAAEANGYHRGGRQKQPWTACQAGQSQKTTVRTSPLKADRNCAPFGTTRDYSACNALQPETSIYGPVRKEI